MITNRYINVLPLICILLALPASAAEKLYRVGFLGSDHWELAVSVPGQLDAMGYARGKDVIYEQVAATALTQDRLPELAVELVAWNPDVIVTSDVVAARAAAGVTKSIPIVTTVMVDPVKAGLVDSVSKPGRNVTGVVLPSYELVSKKLELLRELVPQLRRVGVIFDPATEHGVIAWQNTQTIAANMELEVEPLALDMMSDVVPALEEAVNSNSGAFLVVEGKTARQHAREINEFVIPRGIPAMYPNADFVEWLQGLISYGPDIFEIRSDIAELVDRILKGAVPGELPMRQVTQYALVLRRNVAMEMGIEIPQTILVRTTRVLD